jgi:primosomal replication protein N
MNTPVFDRRRLNVSAALSLVATVVSHPVRAQPPSGVKLGELVRSAGLRAE